MKTSALLLLDIDHILLSERLNEPGIAPIWNSRRFSVLLALLPVVMLMEQMWISISADDLVDLNRLLACVAKCQAESPEATALATRQLKDLLSSIAGYSPYFGESQPLIALQQHYLVVSGQHALFAAVKNRPEGIECPELA